LETPRIASMVRPNEVVPSGNATVLTGQVLS
jgi:hypothetical protein